jgi:hypothetical protein
MYIYLIISLFIHSLINLFLFYSFIYLFAYLFTYLCMHSLYFLHNQCFSNLSMASRKITRGTYNDNIFYIFICRIARFQCHYKYFRKILIEILCPFITLYISCNRDKINYFMSSRFGIILYSQAHFK